MSAHVSGFPQPVEQTDISGSTQPESSEPPLPSLISARPRSSNGQFVRVVRAHDAPAEPGKPA